MYRNPEEYNKLDRLIYGIYLDYGISSFPIDEQELCQKMRIALVPYSAFENDAWSLLLKKSNHAFFVRESTENIPTIYYNDLYESKGAIRLSIFHEIKHYICEDEDDKTDDLADYFGRHLMCPTAYLMLKGIDTPNEIVSFCGVSFEAARYTSSNIQSRREKYGYTLMSYERDFIKQIEPMLLRINAVTPGGESMT